MSTATATDAVWQDPGVIERSLVAFHERTQTKKTRAEVEAEYYRRPDKAANRLVSVELQCAWLRELGYEHVDCFFKIFELALFGGMKPSEG